MRSSHQITDELKTGKEISCNSEQIHRISAAKSTSALYSDYVEDLETVFCFLEDHETRDLPKNTQYVPLDFLSSRETAQSAIRVAIQLHCGKGLDENAMSFCSL